MMLIEKQLNWPDPANFRRIFAVLVISFVFLSDPLSAQVFVAGSSVGKEEVLRKIPREYIDKARRELVIAYQHTSHGTHVARGMFGLPDYKTGDTTLFGISETPAADSLEFRDYALEDYAPPGVNAIDLSVDEDAFIQTSRNYLDAPENATVNVVMWSWCNIDGHDVPGVYLPGMDSLINEYGPGGSRIGTGPGQREVPVTFIFMTGHANVDANVGEPTRPMEQADTITRHCDSIQQFCLDYYSIDTHDMDDNYWEDAGDDGNSADYGGNFYHDWQDSHVLGEDYFENKMAPGGTVAFGEHNTQHITANRKGYAMWWILARIAGWDGDTSFIPVTGIEFDIAGDSSAIRPGDTLRISATVVPDSATCQELDWSLIQGSGTGSIDSLGLFTAGEEGTVMLVATARDTVGFSDTLYLNILPALIPVTSITVESDGGLTELRSGESHQFSATVLPDSASNREVNWSVFAGSGTALIDTTGLLTAVMPGTVTVLATAKDNSGISGNFPLNILPPLIPVSSISIQSAGGDTLVDSGETLQFSALVLPDNASSKELEWTVSNGSGTASISVNGLLSAANPGTVTVWATAMDGSGVTDDFPLRITAPVVAVSSITISPEGDVNELISGASLQFSAHILPEDASNKELDWTVSNGTGTASISEDGLLTAGIPGTVTVMAAAMDGSGVSSSFELNIASPTVAVTSIEINTPGGISELEEGEMMQLSATVMPENADNPSVHWHVTAAKNSSGQGSITSDGLFIAIAEGDVDVVAVAQDGSDVHDLFVITILGPSSIGDNSSAGVILYPNPGRDLFYLDGGGLEFENIQVLNAQGALVLELAPGPGKQLIELDLSGQQSGLYIVKAKVGDQFIIRQAILNR